MQSYNKHLIGFVLLQSLDSDSFLKRVSFPAEL